MPMISRSGAILLSQKPTCSMPVGAMTWRSAVAQPSRPSNASKLATVPEESSFFGGLPYSLSASVLVSVSSSPGLTMTTSPTLSPLSLSIMASTTSRL